MARTAPPLLEAVLNGSREHPRAPRTPAELSQTARECVDAGARVLHLHPFDAAGRETLAVAPCAAALEAVRAACPGVPVSLSTSAEIEPDARRRLGLVDGLASWAVNERALARGHGIRTGLEDTAVLPDGRPACDNAALVRAAAAMIARR